MIAVPGGQLPVPVPAGRGGRAPSRRIASTVCVGSGWASRTLGRGDGAVIGGRLLLRRWPDVARRLASGRRIVLVSGTNGKTTTTSLLARALGTAGPVGSNATGANTPPGIVSALARSGADTVVLECDEAWLDWCIRLTRPECVVLLNLSRDQLDRNQEVSGLARRWRGALGDVPTVVANADDPQVAWAAGAAPRQVWVAGGIRWIGDAGVCPACGALLPGGTAAWACASCGLRRATPSWSVRDGLIRAPDGPAIPLRLALPGRVNQANATFAVAAAALLGVDAPTAARSLAAVAGVDGRYAVHRVAGHAVRLLLAKNPAGWQEALAISAAAGNPVAVAVNAREADGRDPSWIYDIDVSTLRGRPVVVAGERFLDVAVRMMADRIPVRDAAADVLATLGRLPTGPVDLIANYTAFTSARTELRRAG